MAVIDSGPRDRQTESVMSPSLNYPLCAVRTSVRRLMLTTLLVVMSGTAMAEEGRTVVVDEPPSSDAAATTTVVTRAEMGDALSDLGEVLDRQAGLRVTRLGGLGSYATASLRGSTSEQVLVLLDGLPLISAEGGPVDLAMLPLGLLRRVTITRGTSPAAFGVSAIGGVIDIRLREPLGPLAEFEVGAGSFDSRSARAFVGHGNGASGGSLGVDYQGSAGDFPFRHDGGTAWESDDGEVVARDNNGYDQVTTLARGRLVATDAISIRVLDLVSWRRRGIPGIGLYEGSGAVLETLRHTMGGEVAIDLGGKRGAALTLVPWFSWSASSLNVADGGTSLGGGSTDAESDVLGSRLHVTIPLALDDDAAWLLEPKVTLAYRREAYKGTGVVDSPADAQRHRMAAVGELSLRAAPLNAALVTSGRYEGTWSRTADTDEVRGDEGSVRAGLAYAPVGGTTLTMNVGQGARFPSPFELFGFTATTRGNAVLRPERGLSLDGGISHEARWLPAGSYGSVELTGFASWTDDLIQFVRNSQGVSRPENVAAAFIGGIEAGLWCDLFSHLRFRSSVTWMHSEDRSDIAARRGKRLPYRPTWKTYGRLEGYGAVASDGAVGLALEVEHLAGDVLDHANLVENPDRIFIGVAAWFEALNGQVRLSLNLRNLMDVQSVDFQGYPLPGITAMATLKWSPQLE